MALNQVNNETYEFVPEKVGTFTPSFTPTSNSYLYVKQVGNVVYLSGVIAIDGTWADLSGYHLGDISGVSSPSSTAQIAVQSYQNSDELHAGYIIISSNYIAANVKPTDHGMIINGFYFTA